MGRYRKDNITLQLRVPADMAISFLGRMYGKGLITREQYIARVKIIDREEFRKQEEKARNFDRMIENSRIFYKKGLKN